MVDPGSVNADEIIAGQAGFLDLTKPDVQQRLLEEHDARPGISGSRFTLGLEFELIALIR